MRRYNDAEIAQLEIQLDQALAQVADLKRHHPILIELRAQSLGLRRSKGGIFYYPEELEWLFEDQAE